jgi:hypothetical protein
MRNIFKSYYACVQSNQHWSHTIWECTEFSSFESADDFYKENECLRNKSGKLATTFNYPFTSWKECVLNYKLNKGSTVIWGKTYMVEKNSQSS